MTNTTDTYDIIEAVANIAREAGIEKFQPEDAERFAFVGDEPVELSYIAYVYANTYRGTFSFMQDMAAAARRWNHLTAGQAKGVLNCMMAEARRAAAPAPVAIEDGMYRLGETIYKVQHAVHGSGRQYAKALTDVGGDWKFVYAGGVVYKLTPADRLTLEEAKAFGALYGTCCCCGRTLTDENSIAAGIGPVCAARL